MEEEKHLNATVFHKSDDVFTKNKPFNPPSNHKTHTNKCLVYILLAVVLQSIAFLVFGLVVLRITAPSLSLLNVVVKDLRYGSASLNMTMLAQLRLHNSNFARFNFHGGSATLLYGNATIAAADISDGGVGKRERRNINTTVKVMAAFNGDQNWGNYSRDVELGIVKLKSLAEMRGEVRVVKIVHRYRTAVMNCTMDLNLTTQTVQRFSC